jgi:hypothetical protein
MLVHGIGAFNRWLQRVSLLGGFRVPIPEVRKMVWHRAYILGKLSRRCEAFVLLCVVAVSRAIALDEREARQVAMRVRRWSSLAST